MVTTLRKMKPKISRKGDETKASGYDTCLTPPYALAPLYPYLPKDKVIWESAVGQGHLMRDMESNGYIVIGTDITSGHNFFEYAPDIWDIQVTNPPYSLKFKWMQRSYDLGKPFALLLPVEAIGAKKAQLMMQKYGYEIMLLEQRVDFCMPSKGWEGAGAQFPVLWYCWQLLPDKNMFGSFEEEKKAFKLSLNENQGR